MKRAVTQGACLPLDKIFPVTCAFIEIARLPKKDSRGHAALHSARAESIVSVSDRE